MPTATAPTPYSVQTDPELLTRLLRSMEGQYLQVISTTGQVTVGQLRPNGDDLPDSTLVLGTVTGRRYEVDVSDIANVIATNDVPF